MLTMTYNRLINYSFVNNSEAFIHFSFPDTLDLASPSDSHLDLIVYYNQIIVSYANHCFNFPSLAVFNLFLPCASAVLRLY